MKYIIIIFTGGGIGAVTRYLMAGYFNKLVESQFPVGTFAVNIVGCFLIGLLMTLFNEKFISDQSIRLFVTIGFLGGFTTYSSFSYESFQLLKDSNYFEAFGNIFGTTISCLISTWLGVAASRLIVS